ncbi:immunoglobulin-binding protein 1 [Bombina bombina]|uniref:immunoglobulin-binding protein 1 n=1 Tax=Bombina bombina TaxID=8345 RepID=UPI00235AD6BB|nr:immunoglobulin-binding protein 1 [Bombina bombina]
MAEVCEAEFPNLSELFQKGWSFLEDVERNSNQPTASSEMQNKVKRGIGMLEQATRMVSQLDLFSANEELEELSTSDIKFLLLPALLGSLTLKQVGLSHRLQHLENARSYFMDFLRRCHNYKVSQFQLPPSELKNSVEEQDIPQTVHPPAHANLTAMAVHRQAKIARYKQKKELESRVSGLQEAVRSGSAEEEQVREFYLLQLQSWVCIALEEIESIDQELPLVRSREAMKKGSEVRRPHEPSRTPMKPFILTRDALQAKVFGAGYPSLPTMTVDDWYDQHRKKGVLPDQGVISHTKDEEQEAAEREKKEEEDDPDTLQKARHWEDWKDTHPRGYGNRKNMG